MLLRFEPTPCDSGCVVPFAIALACWRLYLNSDCHERGVSRRLDDITAGACSLMFDWWSN